MNVSVSQEDKRTCSFLLTLVCVCTIGHLPVPANERWYTIHELSCEGNEACLQNCASFKMVNFSETVPVASVTCSGMWFIDKLVIFLSYGSICN